ncbi:MAG: glycogen/starch/alpha-glucan phosphorylase [Tissierellia bacterium]|nr:glycogen/starch/alpha-glucan phosphorylase [Tissierellia bacterium]
MTDVLDVKNLKSVFEFMLKSKFGKSNETATKAEKYNALASAVMSLLADAWNDTRQKQANKKRAFYFSAEFLVGRALGNNILNLDIENEVRDLLNELGMELNEIEELEEDAALGNGGLGRLAACFMESGATEALPLDGYGVRYSEGLFKQSFVDGFQHEEGDTWIKHGYPWAIRMESDSQVIHFKNQSVVAVPYDMPIIGYRNGVINTLRLWQSEAIDGFDFAKFNNFEYDQSVREQSRAEDITRVLYPNDIQRAGKVLRLKQQYFFVSASLKDLVKKYKQAHPEDPEFKNFADYHAIQLNDTHPVVGIPELMRIFLDHEHLKWEESWKTVTQVFSFTNHTILQEAMEVWSIDIMDEISPRIVEIIREIDKNFIASLKDKNYWQDKIDRLRIIRGDAIHMAALGLYGASAVNGVAALHTNILKTETLREWYELYPEKFQNKTNGVTPRRWLVYSNPELAAFITELLGSDSWIVNLEELKGLEKFVDDEKVLKRINDIKFDNKVKLAAYIKEVEGIEIDPNSIFDVQVKRLHEYKRQLLNALHIVDLYKRLKENPDLDIVPRTFIFGAKAAPGYFRAKAIIKFINEIARVINSDDSIQGKIKVVFVQNFRVSYGEKIYPATDVSEQISTAGKEASGTGNMKFMMNATPTLGTFDGANVEIVQEAGEENNFVFGARVEEIREIRDNYNPIEFYANDYNIKRAVDSLISGEFTDNGSYMFLNIYNSLVQRDFPEKLDQYFILKDFESYRDAQMKIDTAYRDRMGWAKKCLMNVANSGKFSSDRTILEYAREIWKVK